MPLGPRTRTAILIAVALAIPIIPFALIGELPGERWLSATDDSALLFGLTGAGLLALDVLLPIPSSIVGTMLGGRLGLGAGLGWTFLGLTAGNLIGYAVGRLMLRRLGEELPKTPTLVALFLTRPVPVFAEAVTVAAGAGGVRIGRFLAVSMAGNAIYAFVLAANGAALLPARWTGLGLLLPMSLPVAAWLLWRRYGQA